MLEIHVSDEVKISDDLEKTIIYIQEAIQRWLDEDVDEPLTIVVKKEDNKSPPTIEINVTETIKVKEALG